MAPASGYVVTDGLPDRILAILAKHPEGLRIADLSRKVFPDAPVRAKATMTVGTECSRLYRTGRVTRTQRSVPGRKVPITRYRLPELEPATTST